MPVATTALLTEPPLSSKLLSHCTGGCWKAQTTTTARIQRVNKPTQKCPITFDGLCALPKPDVVAILCCPSKTSAPSWIVWDVSGSVKRIRLLSTSTWSIIVLLDSSKALQYFLVCVNMIAYSLSFWNNRLDYVLFRKGNIFVRSFFRKRQNAHFASKTELFKIVAQKI